MCRTEDGIIRFAPLYIHSFRLIAPRKLLDAQLFNQKYRTYEEIGNVPDRLRWLRHKLGMMQKDSAEAAGVSRSYYIHLENGECEKYPLPVMDKLAELYRVPVTDLLDAYNRFLYDGQGQQIRSFRLGCGMTVSQFADHLGVYASTVRKWESDRAVILKRTWEKIMSMK